MDAICEFFFWGNRDSDLERIFMELELRETEPGYARTRNAAFRHATCEVSQLPPNRIKELAFCRHLPRTVTYVVGCGEATEVREFYDALQLVSELQCLSSAYADQPEPENQSESMF